MKRFSAYLLLLSLAVVACAAAPPVSHSPDGRKVVMVVMPAVSLDDLTCTDLPTIRKLMATGSTGLMNSRTSGRLDPEAGSFTDPRYTPESGYVTLGAGARAIAGMEARKAFNRAELMEGAPAHIVFERRTLVNPGASEVVHPGIARLTYDNSDLNYEVTIGLLGRLLHDAHLKTAAIGNSDAWSAHREVAAICMDGDGLVDFGNVGRSMVVRDPEAALAMRTDVPRLLREAARCIRLADFVVIELGDTARLDRARLDMTDRVFQRERVKVLKETDRALGHLLASMNLQNTRLIVLSPYPSSYAVEQTGNSLCPVLVAGRGFRRGLLTSGSTRMPGVVANTDIAASVLEWLGAPAPPALVGRPITSVTHLSPVEELRSLDRRASLQTASQPVLREVMIATIVLVGIIAVLWLILPQGHSLRRKAFPAAIMFPPSLALAMLLLTLYPSGSHLITWLALIALSAALVAVAVGIGRNPIRALMLISLGLAVLIVIDLATGGRLCRYSIMGYSVVDGSRYYGIGNEFMGALIGSSVVGIGLLLGALRAGQRAARISLLCGLIVAAAVVGFPAFGANTGGAIAVVIAFGFALAATCKRPFDLRRMALITLGAVAILVIFAILDSLRGQEYESHLGKTVRLALAGGLEHAGMLVKRKLAMNLLLIRVSVWSRLLAAYAIGAGVALKAGGFMLRPDPLPLHLRAALAGAVSGTLGALIFNDSGIVAAATCFVYAWALILLTVLDTQEHSPP